MAVGSRWLKIMESWPASWAVSAMGFQGLWLPFQTIASKVETWEPVESDSTGGFHRIPRIPVKASLPVSQ